MGGELCYFEIYVRILSLKHHYFQFYQWKVPCFSSIREISVRLTIIFSVTSSVSHIGHWSVKDIRDIHEKFHDMTIIP